MTDEPTAEDENEVNRIAYHYVKSPAFRTLHMDGAMGASTPSGMLHMAIYAERPAIPQRTEHEVDADGRVGAMIPAGTVAKSGVVRELQADVMMDPGTAVALLLWLAEQLEVRGLDLEEALARRRTKPVEDNE